MDHVERAVLIAQYATGYDVVADAIDGATEAELDGREAPGEWSPRQVVHHLADSEMTSAIRIRRILVEDDPLIQGYDQEAFADRLHYERPIETSLLAFRAARDSTTDLIQRLSDDDWLRAGTHSQYGRYTAEDWLRDYAAHAPDHADQIRRARAIVTTG